MNRFIGLILGTLILLPIVFSTACNRKVTTESGRTAYKLNPATIPLVPTEQNSGKRCDYRNYTYPEPVEPEDKKDSARWRFCYSMTERLVEASSEGNLAEITEALKLGANVNGTYYESVPPLIAAASEGKVDAVVLLLDNGADINYIRDFQNTALNSAASEGHTDVVKVLIERGADICYGSPDITAEKIAQSSGFTETANAIKAARPFGCQWSGF